MDGIFGVGIAEIIIIGLVLFIIGGPENTAKWARELGRWVRKGREVWADVMAQLENELGDDGKDIVDAAREVGQEMRELRSMTSPRGVMRSTLGAELKEVESDLKNPLAPPSVAQKKADGVSADAPKPLSTAANQNSDGAAGDEMVADPDIDTNPVQKSGSMYTAWMPPDKTSE